MKFFFIILISLFIGCMNRDISVDGNVINSISDEPIAKVKVTFKGSSEESVYTDENGYFEVTGEYDTDYVNNSWFYLYFEKSHYETKKEFFYIEEDHKNLVIKM